MTDEQLAKLFHDTYEFLAPSFGYKTREASAKPWKDVPQQNKRLMVAVAGKILLVLNAELKAALDMHRWIPVEERLPEGPGVWLVLSKGIPESYRQNDDSSLWKGFAKTYTHWKPIILPEGE